LLAILLAVASVSGLALAHGASPVAALLAAGALSLLPVAGVASLLGDGNRARVAAGLLWPACLLIAMPHYLPGERAPAIDRGLRWLASPLGTRVAGSIAGTAGGVVALLGEDRAPLPSMAPRPAGAAADAGTTVAILEADAPPRGQIEERRIRLAYEGDGRSLRLPVVIDGPDVSVRFDLLFDTGASFTTLSPAALEQLGVRIASDAPRVSMRTANGEIEAKLVLLDAIWLGDDADAAVVEWVTIAVCESCAATESAGLLGLNVTSQFRISLDHARRQMELTPRDQASDRHLDVGPWLELRSEGRRWWDGRVEVGLAASNHARRAVERLVVELDCGGDAFAIQLDDVEAGGEASTEVTLPPGTDCRQQRLSLRSARWRLDRF
jgi:predicted aspartyl protease